MLKIPFFSHIYFSLLPNYHYVVILNIILFSVPFWSPPFIEEIKYLTFNCKQENLYLHEILICVHSLYSGNLNKFALITVNILHQMYIDSSGHAEWVGVRQSSHLRVSHSVYWNCLGSLCPGGSLQMNQASGPDHASGKAGHYWVPGFFVCLWSLLLHLWCVFLTLLGGDGGGKKCSHHFSECKNLEVYNKAVCFMRHICIRKNSWNGGRVI